MNFVIKKNARTKFVCKNKLFRSLRMKNKHFKVLGQNKFQARFKDKNNNLTYFLFKTHLYYG